MIYNNYLSNVNFKNDKLKDFIMSSNFRKKFIYDSIIYDKSYNKSLKKIKLFSNNHQKEFENFINTPFLIKIINLPLFSRILRFIYLFRILGFLEIIKVFVQRIYYKYKTC